MYLTKQQQEDLQFLRQFFDSIAQQAEAQHPGIAEVLPDVSMTFTNDLSNLQRRLVYVLDRAKPGTPSGTVVQRAARDGWRNPAAWGTWDPELKEAGRRQDVPDWAWT